MDYKLGKETLMIHSGLLDHPAIQNGLLGSLRPYRGIAENDFHQLIEAIVALSSCFLPEAVPDRDVMYSILNLTHTVRLWALSPKGMLRRNKLIDEAAVEKLAKWLEIIERIVLGYFRGFPTHRALLPFLDYLASCEHPLPSTVSFVLPHCVEAIQCDDPDIRSVGGRILGALGEKAFSAIPIIQAVLEQYADLETQNVLQDALAQIRLTA